jgi:type IV fimbrial biogenesis protein FimT
MGGLQRHLLGDQKRRGVLSAARSQRGVTLIELMIGVVIMAILFGLALPSYKDWIQNTQIRTAAESIQNGLQLARAEAVSRNTPVSFTLAGNDWTVAVVAPALTIQSKTGAEGSTNAVIAVNPAVQTTTVFNGLGRVTPAAAVTFSVTNPVGGTCQPAVGGAMRCLNVLVSNSGQIRMCDPALALASNPQGCS